MQQANNRIVFVRNLPLKITGPELYDLFGKFGAVRQIRLGDDAPDTRGTCFVVYHQTSDARKAVEHLNGFNLLGRYLVALYFDPNKVLARKSQALAASSAVEAPDQDRTPPMAV